MMVNNEEQPQDAGCGDHGALGKADAIILRNGAALAHPDGDGSMEIGSTRGITLDGSGALCVRSLGMFQIDYEIVRK